MSAVGLAPGSADGKRDLTLDAIIVPASRPAHHLEQAVDLAQATRCALLILCSRRGNRVADVARPRLAADLDELPTALFSASDYLASLAASWPPA